MVYFDHKYEALALSILKAVSLILGPDFSTPSKTFLSAMETPIRESPLVRSCLNSLPKLYVA